MAVGTRAAAGGETAGGVARAAGAVGTRSGARSGARARSSKALVAPSRTNQTLEQRDEWSPANEEFTLIM